MTFLFLTPTPRLVELLLELEKKIVSVGIPVLFSFLSILSFSFLDTVIARWCTPLIPTLERQRQEDLCEFEARLVYKASCRTARATQRETLSQGNCGNGEKE